MVCRKKKKIYIINICKLRNLRKKKHRKKRAECINAYSKSTTEVFDIFLIIKCIGSKNIVIFVFCNNMLATTIHLGGARRSRQF